MSGERCLIIFECVLFQVPEEGGGSSFVKKVDVYDVGGEQVLPIHRHLHELVPELLCHLGVRVIDGRSKKFDEETPVIIANYITFPKRAICCPHLFLPSKLRTIIRRRRPQQCCQSEWSRLFSDSDFLDEHFGLGVINIVFGEQRLGLWDFEV